MKTALELMIVIMFAWLLTGCRTAGGRSAAVSVPATNAVDRALTGRNPPDPLAGAWHTVQVIPRPKDISFWDQFNPIWWMGNVADPEPPWWFRPDDKARRLKWYIRNPFHNFTFYVIGIADKPHERSGRYPRRVGNPNGGWDYALARYKWLRLPFISYKRSKFDFYLGWRTGGNFGAKINFNATRPPRSKPAEVQSSPPSDSTSAPATDP